MGATENACGELASLSKHHCVDFTGQKWRLLCVFSLYKRHALSISVLQSPSLWEIPQQKYSEIIFETTFETAFPFLFASHQKETSSENCMNSKYTNTHTHTQISFSHS